jgi:hypothetical protein
MASRPPGPPHVRPGRQARLGVAGLLVLLVVVVAGLAALRPSGEDARPRPAGAGRGSPPGRGVLAPDRGALIGAWAAPSRSDGSEPVVELEARLGRRLAINHHFYPWRRPFPTWRERVDLAVGRIPMISWNGTFTDRIAAGEEDLLVRARAAAVRVLGRPVLLRWFWEMDGNAKAEWVRSPAGFVAAWRHLHDLFAAEGANNAVWVWCPNADAFAGARGGVDQYYPGDQYVDWLCADGYNWAPGRRGDRWQSFAEIFGAFYAWTAPKGKPLMVGEFGVQERAPGEKARWIANAGRAVRDRFPALAALVYFNENKLEEEQRGDKRYDWRIQTSPSAEAAFRALAADPYFRAGQPRDLAP